MEGEIDKVVVPYNEYMDCFNSTHNTLDHIGPLTNTSLATFAASAIPPTLLQISAACHVMDAVT
jgi:hypothetical protein